MHGRLSDARFAVVVAIAIAFFSTGIVAGAAGASLIIGSQANNAGTASTQLLTNSDVVAFKLLQLGPSTALMGYATSVAGTTRGVYGRVDSPNGDGVQARNAAVTPGTGAALHAFGGQNPGAMIESDGTVPLVLTGPGGMAPMTVSSAIKVANLNADALDGLDSTQLARNDQQQHYSCMGSDMAPLGSDATYVDNLGERWLTAGADFATCAVHLPDDATVTGFMGDVGDSSTSYETICGLYAFTPNVDPVQVAVTPSSGVGATPGYASLAASSITNGVIDNGQYAYSAFCLLDGGAGSDISVLKVTVTYVGAP